MTPLQTQAIKKMQHCMEVASRYFNRAFPMPILSFNQRGKVAGTARLQKWEIRINPILLEENQQPFIDEVLPHELAHLLAYELYGRVKPHGKEWQAIMNHVFQIPAKTTHSFNIESVKGRTFSYHCQCAVHELTLRRHNKVKRHQAEYVCQKCKTALHISPTTQLS